MIYLALDDSIYHVEFRHVRKDGAHPALGRNAPIAAITTCVIIATKAGEPLGLEPSEILFTAIGNAICALDDAFSRRKGRLLSFYKAVTHCGALRDVREALLAAYLNHDPPCVEIRPALTQPEKAVLWQRGWEKRKQREERRGEALRRAIAGEAAERSAS